MASRTHAKDADYSFNGVALESDLRRIEQVISVPEANITSFADAWQNFLAGKKNVRTTIEGVYNPSASQLDATLFARLGLAAVSTIFDPTGTGPAAGAPEYQCTASGLTGVLIDSIEIEIPVNAEGRITATLQHSGSTSRAVA